MPQLNLFFKCGSPAGFEERFESRSEFYTKVADEIIVEYTLGIGLGKSLSNTKPKGVIYEVDGGYTPSGRPYIGRHKNPTPYSRSSADGRDRSKARIIDTYDPENIPEGQYKEQKAMDKRGGVKQLDNKRREVSPKKQQELQKKFDP